MASLRELKTRINSVNSTKKITSAMQMVSSAKLNRVQATIGGFAPYQKKLDAILTNVLASDSSFDTPYTQRRVRKRVAIVVFASNTSLCGSFNSATIRAFNKTYANFVKKGINGDDILVYPVGAKVAKALKKTKAKVQGNFDEMAHTPSYEEAQELAKRLIKKFVSGEIDEVRLIYHEFISIGRQQLIETDFLPFNLKAEANKTEEAEVSKKYNVEVEYVYEPSKNEILESLIPTVLYSRLYGAVLHSNASEHAARMLAMQTATDNAEDLNEDLTILYNQSRQQAVTNELLDIIGGSSALQ